MKKLHLFALVLGMGVLLGPSSVVAEQSAPQCEKTTLVTAIQEGMQEGMHQAKEFDFFGFKVCVGSKSPDCDVKLPARTQLAAAATDGKRKLVEERR